MRAMADRMSSRSRSASRLGIEVGVDLAVPGGVVAFPDERSELCQFIGRECGYCSLYFGETHSQSISNPLRERNAPEDHGGAEIQRK